MSTTHKIIPYWVSLNERHTSNKWDLTKIDEESEKIVDETIIDLMDSFCDEYDVDDEEYFNLKRITDMEKTFTVGHYEKGERVIEGIFKTGTYGTGADHIDTENDDFTENAQGPLDSVILPYYFALALPENYSNKALIVLQKIGNKGTKVPFEEVMKNYLKPRKGYINFDPEITEKLFYQIDQAERLLELEFEKQMKAKSAHDNVSDVFEDEGALNHKLVYGHVRNSNLQVAKEKLKESLFNSERTGITIGNQTYNEGRLTAKVNGSQRSFALFQEEAEMERIINPEKDNIDMDRQNHPKPSSISKLSREFMNEILERYSGGSIPEETLLD